MQDCSEGQTVTTQAAENEVAVVQAGRIFVEEAGSAKHRKVVKWVGRRNRGRDEIARPAMFLSVDAKPNLVTEDRPNSDKTVNLSWSGLRHVDPVEAAQFQRKSTQVGSSVDAK